MNMDDIVGDFRQVAMLAGIAIMTNNITIEIFPAPHIPPDKLPVGKLAVYAFFFCDKCLKVGKVGAKSQARYTSQHYSPNSSNSNLAKSILMDRVALGLTDIDENSIGEWIKKNTCRYNILLDESLGMRCLALLETFLQCRLKPRFEGYESQR